MFVSRCVRHVNIKRGDGGYHIICPEVKHLPFDLDDDGSSPSDVVRPSFTPRFLRVFVSTRPEVERKVSGRAEQKNMLEMS